MASTTPGAERVQDLLAQRLAEHGFQVGFACLKPGQFPRGATQPRGAALRVPMRSRLDLRVVAGLVRSSAAKATGWSTPTRPARR